MHQSKSMQSLRILPGSSPNWHALRRTWNLFLGYNGMCGEARTHAKHTWLKAELMPPSACISCMASIPGQTALFFYKKKSPQMRSDERWATKQTLGWSNMTVTCIWICQKKRNEQRKRKESRRNKTIFFSMYFKDYYYCSVVAADIQKEYASFQPESVWH